MIAPGIICPKCKGPMLDERLTKRTDKSPDYTCANMLCMETKNGKSYRTAIWAEKSSGAEAPSHGSAGGVGNTGNSASAPSAEHSTAKPKMRDAYKDLTKWVIKEIMPVYESAFGVESFTPDVAAACCQTLFIQACKSGKVE